jgi:hypothetical protein
VDSPVKVKLIVSVADLKTVRDYQIPEQYCDTDVVALVLQLC